MSGTVRQRRTLPMPRHARLVKARQAKNLKQADLGLLVGVSVATIADIEAFRTLPSWSLRDEIASALEQDINYLFPKSLLNTLRSGVYGRPRIMLDESQRVDSLVDSGKLPDWTMDSFPGKLLRNP